VVFVFNLVRGLIEMAHSLKYQIGESVRTIEAEVGKLLDLAATLREAGDEEMAGAVSTQANKLLEAAVALRIAMSG
jgi:hypothetical protein